MKKYLFLLSAFALIFFTSCSNDDDGGDSQDHSIVANWNLTSVSPEIPIWDIMVCEQNPAISFKQDGTTEWTLYDAENQCAEVKDSGSWERIEGNNYQVSIPPFGKFDGVVTFSGENKFTFKTNITGFPNEVTLTFQK